MLRLVHVICLILVFISKVNAQIANIDSLKMSKYNLTKKIKTIEDSIKLIDAKIKIVELRLNQNVNLTKVIGVCNSNAVMRLNPNPLATIIDSLKVNQKVNILDYSEGYFGVNYENQYGYINEVWLTNSDSLSKFKENILNRQSNLSNKLKEEEYIKKYGASNYKKIKNGQYWIGMKDDMAIIALGKPTKINRTVGSWGIHEQWVYENTDVYLYFENGKLTSYQN